MKRKCYLSRMIAFRTTHYDANGNILFYYETEYDENHEWISETKYDADGTILEQRKRK